MTLVHQMQSTNPQLIIQLKEELAKKQVDDTKNKKVKKNNKEI